MIPILSVAGLCWPIVLNAVGASTNGVVLDKAESIRIEYGDWFRQFRVTGGYSIPGQRVEHRAVCDVDESTYDSLHIGSPVVVRYLGNFPPQPFLTTSRLAPCSIVGISTGPSVWRLVVIGAGLLGILFLWWILLMAWLCFSCADAFMPRVEPQPHDPVATTATVNSVIPIETLAETSETDGIPLQHPYEIVAQRERGARARAGRPRTAADGAARSAVLSGPVSRAAAARAISGRLRI